jgi:hypothetical protein
LKEEIKVKKSKFIEKNIALFQMFVIITGMISFAYFIGQEFQLVGAVDVKNTQTEDGKNELEQTVQKAIDIITLPSALESAHDALTKLGDSLRTTTGTEEAHNALIKAAEEMAKGGSSTPAAALGFWDVVAQIGTNAAIAYGIYGGTKLIVSWIPGASEQLKESLALSLAIGYGIGATIGMVSSWLGVAAEGTFLGAFASSLGLGTMFTGLAGGLMVAGAALIVWLIVGQEYRVDAVVFTCSEWQPESGGDNCGECNKGILPCTEYKCKSLGASCELVNVETEDEVCVSVDENDRDPPIISSWTGALKEGYSYSPESATLPASSTGKNGVRINYSEDENGCIPQYDLVTYGINLGEDPGRCKWDVIPQADFSSMRYEASNGKYLYNHTLSAFSPSTYFPKGGEYELYVRCEDKAGNSNAGTFVFEFCVNEEDTNPPEIKTTNPLNGMPIANGKTTQEITVYINKPSECKWSTADIGFDSMENTMTCSNTVNSRLLYECGTTLNGLSSNGENKFYFNCKSYPELEESERYTMWENYEYTLIGTVPLAIQSVSPVSGSVVTDSTEEVKVTLGAKTISGYDDGISWCSYKPTGSSGNYVLFANTNSYEHSQNLWFEEGEYSYDIQCCDLGGNCDNETTEFSVETDFESPRIIRMYKTGSNLKLVTNEKASCVYSTTSCEYNFEDGIGVSSSDEVKHDLIWDTEKTYYIKCKDDFNNQPISDECTIIARPSNTF